MYIQLNYLFSVDHFSTIGDDRLKLGIYKCGSLHAHTNSYLLFSWIENELLNDESGDVFARVCEESDAVL